MVQLYISRYNYSLNDVNSIEDLVEKTECNRLPPLPQAQEQLRQQQGQQQHQLHRQQAWSPSCSSLGNQFLNVLASKLSDNLVNLGVIGLDTNSLQSMRVRTRCNSSENLILHLEFGLRCIWK
jgi:hypothetical protein